MTNPLSPATVAVIGGGVAGLSLARALAARGARAVVLERDRLGARGASALPVALLNPYRGRKGAAHPDDLRGLRVTLRWAAELRALGLSPGVHESGVLRIPPTERQAASWRERHDPEGPASAAWLSAGQVPAPFTAPHGALRVGRGGWLWPAAWRAALVEAARRDGGELREGAHVRVLEERADGVAVVVDDGRLEAEAAVLCVGADPLPHPEAPRLELSEGDVVELTGAPPLPMALAGAVYATSTAALGRPRAPGAGEVDGGLSDTDGGEADGGLSDGGEADGGLSGGGAAHGDARVWVGGHHREPGARPTDAAQHLRDALARFVPAAAEAEIRRVWSGVRARAPGGRPLVEWLSPRVSFMGAFAGRGFLCAAEVAERHADEIVSRLGRSR